MKFDDLYNKVFIAEQEKEPVLGAGDEVPAPENFDDVDPLPLPDVEEPVLATDEAPVESTGGGTLGSYIDELESFADKLNGTGSESLASLVSGLDKIETPFDGISARTTAEIVDAAKTLRSISEKLKNFLIQSAKK